MSLVEGLSGLFQDTQGRARIGKRTLARKSKDATLAVKKEDQVLLQSEDLRNALQQVVPELPGRVKVGLAKPSGDKPMNLVVSFSTRTHLRFLELQWKTMIVGVQHAPQGQVLTINNRALSSGEDLTEACKTGTRISYPRVYELGGTRQGRKDLFDERIMLGRVRMRFPKNK